MPGVVPHRLAAVRSAQHDAMTAATRLGRAGRPALARLPGHDDPARRPRMTIAALLRVRPPVWPSYLLHASIRTRYRTRGVLIRPSQVTTHQPRQRKKATASR